MSSLVKSLITFCIGLALGLLIYPLFAQPVEECQIEKSLIQKAEKQNTASKQAKSDQADDSVECQKELKQLEAEFAQLEAENNREQWRNQQLQKNLDEQQEDRLELPEDIGELMSDAEMQNFETLNAEQNSLATQRLDELKSTQPAELQEIFATSDQEMKKIVESDYKGHLVQERDRNWAHKAEAFLRNHFYAQSNSKFRAIRIDCRTSTCEIAGMLDLQLNQQSTPDGLQIDAVADALFTTEQQLMNSLREASGYAQVFGKGEIRPASVLPEKLKSGRPVAYSMFVQQDKDNS